MRPGDQVKTPDGRVGRVIKNDKATGSVWVRCVQASNVNRTEPFRADSLEVIR